MVKKNKYPNSLGLFYSTATRLLGFKPLHQEAQVMAAAGYGTPKWSDYIKNILYRLMKVTINLNSTYEEELVMVS